MFAQKNAEEDATFTTEKEEEGDVSTSCRMESFVVINQLNLSNSNNYTKLIHSGFDTSIVSNSTHDAVITCTNASLRLPKRPPLKSILLMGLRFAPR